jgi:hypothetical protein
MIQTYSFFDCGTIEFDDTRSVKELLEYALEAFEYYEPFGTDAVALFQGHHSKSNCGWFTTDVSRRCADEIEEPQQLYFACHLPEVFYYAEGGWGHHMKELGNHPRIPNAVSVSLQFDDFDNTVVLNGNYTFLDVVNALKRTSYISDESSEVTVLLIGSGKQYTIPFADPMMRLPLASFLENIDQCHAAHVQLREDDHVYREVFRIC